MTKKDSFRTRLFQMKHDGKSWDEIRELTKKERERNGSKEELFVDLLGMEGRELTGC